MIDPAEVRRLRDEEGMGMNEAVRYLTVCEHIETIENAISVDELRPVLLYLLGRTIGR